MTHARTSARFLAGAGLCALLLALGWAVATGIHEGESGTVESAAPARTGVVTPSRPAPAAARRSRGRLVTLTAVGAFDPEGDGHERDEEARLAVDGKESTGWRTERYSRFFKSGVGLVLDAGRSVRVQQVIVSGPTPGVRAEIRLGSSPEGPFARVSSTRTLTARTSFPVARRAGRYIVIWITALPPGSAGEVSEVRVRAT